jgi:hypothetical protein
MKFSTNALLSLFKIASENEWCYKTVCTTCGHSAFRIAFSKIVRGENPEDESFWPNGKKNSDIQEVNKYKDFVFYRKAKKEHQLTLSGLVAQINLKELNEIAKFPDWLGYIGLVIYHCPDEEAQRVISESLIPQFIELIDESELKNRLNTKLDKKEYISLQDLEAIESFFRFK